MELFLQFGHGMMDHCKSLLQKWGDTTVILSPRDLTPEKIIKFSESIVKRGGKTLIDPQLYNPRSDHHRLVQHYYWPDNYSTSMLLGGSTLHQMLRSIRDLNDACKTDKYIIPGLYCGRVDSDWVNIQEAIIAEAVPIFWDKLALATISLSGEVLRFEEQVEMILNVTESWDVEGYYIVPEHPNGQYLVDDIMWLTNLLILCSGLKLQGKQVIVGYSSHQFLCLALANIDAIASGTWLNVRSFTPDKFKQAEEDNISKRKTWYYCPQSFSEYKLTFLDSAYKQGILEKLRPPMSIESEESSILFSGAQPSSTGYSEHHSFRHYLHSLREQCLQVSRPSFRETFDNYSIMLRDASNLVEELHRHRIKGQDRDFKDIFDINDNAIMALQESRGFILDRQW